MIKAVQLQQHKKWVYAWEKELLVLTKQEMNIQSYSSVMKWSGNQEIQTEQAWQRQEAKDSKDTGNKLARIVFQNRSEGLGQVGNSSLKEDNH